MKCAIVKEMLNAYLDDELSEKEATKIRRHLKECPNCKEQALELNKVRQMVKALPKLKAPAELAEQVTRQLTRIPHSTFRTPNILWRYRWTLRGLATAAAVCLVVYVGLVLIPRQPQIEKPTPTESPKAQTTGDIAKRRDNIPPAPTTFPTEVAAPTGSSTKPDLEIKREVRKEYEEFAKTTSPDDRYTKGSITFSQEIRIACKDTDTALRRIDHIVARSPGKLIEKKEYTWREEEPYAFAAGERRGLIRELSKAKETKKVKPKKKYSIKIVLPLNQREAFIEQLNIQKIGKVEVADLRTTQTENLERPALAKVSKELNGKLWALRKPKGKAEEGISDTSSMKADKYKPEASATSPLLTAKALKRTEIKPVRRTPDGHREAGGNELKDIDKKLIILHDLTQQRELEERLKEEKNKVTDDEFAEETTIHIEQQKQVTKLPLIELIIILEEE